MHTYSRNNKKIRRERFNTKRIDNPSYRLDLFVKCIEGHFESGQLADFRDKQNSFPEIRRQPPEARIKLETNFSQLSLSLSLIKH